MGENIPTVYGISHDSDDGLQQLEKKKKKEQRLEKTGNTKELHWNMTVSEPITRGSSCPFRKKKKDKKRIAVGRLILVYLGLGRERDFYVHDFLRYVDQLIVSGPKGFFAGLLETKKMLIHM